MYASKKLYVSASYLWRVSSHPAEALLQARFLFCSNSATLQKFFCGCRVSIGLFEVLSPKLLTREPYIFIHLGV